MKTPKKGIREIEKANVISADFEDPLTLHGAIYYDWIKDNIEWHKDEYFNGQEFLEDFEKLGDKIKELQNKTGAKTKMKFRYDQIIAMKEMSLISILTTFVIFMSFWFMGKVSLNELLVFQITYLIPFIFFNIWLNYYLGLIEEQKQK